MEKRIKNPICFIPGNEEEIAYFSQVADQCPHFMIFKDPIEGFNWLSKQTDDDINNTIYIVSDELKGLPVTFQFEEDENGVEKRLEGSPIEDYIKAIRQYVGTTQIVVYFLE